LRYSLRSSIYTVQYPRRVIFRSLVRLTGKLLLTTLGKPIIHGKDHLPTEGPMILAGNHVGVMEVVMMAVYAPRQVEFIGTGDIPLDLNYAWIGKLYGLIPVRRGSIDRKGLNDALGILKQRGVLGIFPEGGIWQPDAMQAQIGVAWLSHQSNTAVYPIGFCGMHGALKKALRFERPRLEMNIGKPIKPFLQNDSDKPYKTRLQEHATHILEEIRVLSKYEKASSKQVLKPDAQGLTIHFIDKNNLTIGVPKDHELAHPHLLAMFLNQPVLLDALTRNLKLPVKALQRIQEINDPVQIMKACQSVLDYLEINSGFLTYRFGMDDGLAMKESIAELHSIAQKAAQMDCKLSIEITP